MADKVQAALRRKLAAAQAEGDVHRITILRGMMTADESVEAPAEVEAPEEATAPVEEIVEPEEVELEEMPPMVAVAYTWDGPR